MFSGTFSEFTKEKIPMFEIYIFQGRYFCKPMTNGNQNNREQRE